MIFNSFDFFILGFTSFILTIILTPLMRMLAIRANFMDVPNLKRKTQQTPVPYLGGVAISISISATVYVAILFSNYSSKTVLLATSVLVPAFFMAIVGLVDDLVSMKPQVKLLTQLLAAISVSLVLIITKTSSLWDFSKYIGLVVTISWVVGLVNAVNFFDNHDGASTSVVSIVSFFSFLISIYGGQYFIAALSLVICTSTAAFYFWNKYPAKIYMGDTGALYLGALMATVTIRIKPIELPITKSIFVITMLISIFILDSSVAVISRLTRGKSPMIGGKDHLSHRLVRMGWSKVETAHALQVLSAIFGAFAMATVLTETWVVIIIYLATFALLFKVFYSIEHEDS